MSEAPQRNLFIIAGIGLPLILVILLLLGQFVSNMFVEEPKHDALIVLYDQGPDTHHYRFAVRDGRAQIEAMETIAKDINGNPITNYRRPRLYRYEAKQKNVREIELPRIQRVEGEAPTGQWQVLEIPELQNTKVSSYRISPDGYEFEYGGRYYRGLMGIGGSDYSNAFVLRKGAKRVPIPLADDKRYYYSNDHQFVGWVE